MSDRGGGFLLGPPGDVVTPEGLDDVSRDVAATAAAFAEREVIPVLDRLERGEHELSRQLLRTAGDLGLLANEIPEAYGGLDLSKTVSALIAQRLARTGGFAVTHAAHSSIGTLPLVWFGTDEQKARYLPHLASGEWIAAYALTEPGSGSDALGAATTAVRNGDDFVLNGSKMWITNAGFADLFTLFAKVDGDAFTGFLVERTSPGLTVGPEEHKMGIRSSSTRMVHLDDCRIPAANVLGQIGRGHKIAFNALNVGRYKLGAAAVGTCQRVLELSVVYATERHQFGVPIASFGLMQHKLAEMAVRVFAVESALFRTMGLIDRALDGQSGPQAVLAGIEEYAVEASILKVAGTEVLDMCVDEAVQIHGGMGFSAESEVERHYRDSRVQRIFEGTNEINRLVIARGVMKRVLPHSAGLRDLSPVGALKGYVLDLASAASERFGDALDSEQEVLAALADATMAIYLAESALLRADRRGDALSGMAAQLSLRSAERTVHTSGELITCRLGRAIAAPQLQEPIDVVEMRRTVAAAAVSAGGTPF